jgi:NDP-sugar pyrophosphorylase family protein
MKLKNHCKILERDEAAAISSPGRRAVILAGGRGTRLYPYTHVLPKPLMPIGDYPILEVVVRQLARSGFDHITLAVNHQAEIIRSYFNSGRKWGITIDYSLEKAPLSTMGPLRLIPDLPANFLVMNGDVLTDLDYSEFFDQHVRAGHLFTISACERAQTSEYGVLHVSDTRQLVGFEEKPVVTREVSMGIYMLSKSVLDLIPSRGAYGFDRLMLDMIKAELAVHVRRYRGYWLDIGRPEDYHQAIEVFQNHSERFLKTDKPDNRILKAQARSIGKSHKNGRAKLAVDKAG